VSLAAAKLVAEILELASRVYGTVEDKRLAKRNQERDEKIRELERQLAELKIKIERGGAP
jgi:hypothetical protein